MILKVIKVRNDADIKKIIEGHKEHGFPVKSSVQPYNWDGELYNIVVIKEEKPSIDNAFDFVFYDKKFPVIIFNCTEKFAKKKGYFSNVFCGYDDLTTTSSFVDEVVKETKQANKEETVKGAAPLTVPWIISSLSSSGDNTKKLVRDRLKSATKEDALSLVKSCFEYYGL